MASGEKVLCPWCGAEMRMEVYNDCAFTGGRILGAAWRAFYRCHLCGAQGPEETRSAENKAEEAARAAAIRRYTPPMKPMTWDEVAAMPEMCWYERVEGIEYPILPMAVHGGALKFAIRNGTRYAHAEGYNRTWRCWKREPTDEERSAALWEM